MTGVAAAATRWRRFALFAAVLIAGILPLLPGGLPPLTDLPGHVARWHIAAAAPGSPLTGYYAVHWKLIGNLGADLPALPLLPLVGPIEAARWILIGIVALAMAGMLWLSREAHGRVAPTACLALPFVYGWPFQMGFVNFALAQALALCALALWLRLARTDRPGLRAAIFAPIGVLLWVAHSAGWGMFGLMAFGAELARPRAAGRNWRATLGGAVVACLPLALPVLIMVATRSGDARASETGDWFNLSAKLLWILSPLRDRWMWFDTGALGVLLILLYVAARDRRLGFAPLLGWPALSCLIGFLLLPRLLLGGSYVDMRMMPTIWILSLLAIRPPPPGRFARGLGAAALIFFAARMTGTMLSFDARRVEQRAELGAVAAIPRGAPVLALVYKPCLTPWSDSRPEHLPAFAIIERDAFVNEQWAITGQQYLKIRYAKAAPFDADPSQISYPHGCVKQGRSIEEALRTFPRNAFSHVWIIGKNLRRPRDFGLAPVWSNGHSGLYEVVGTEARLRVDRGP